MPEDMLVRHCAPTLAGLKTGNMFTASFSDKREMAEEVRRLNKLFGAKGLRIMVLRVRDVCSRSMQCDADCSGGIRALLYVYRPGQLRSDLDRDEAREILAGFGYREADHEQCIRRLIRRLHVCEDFPHEIGLFLGYPPEDVKGFIELGGRDCKACGYWKVYGDVDEAKRQFDRFTKCTGVYLKCLERGTPFEKLAVRKKVTA